jgi:hypothetical protein
MITLHRRSAALWSGNSARYAATGRLLQEKVSQMTSITAALRRPAHAAIIVALILAAALVAVVAATAALTPSGGGPHSPGHALADSASPNIYYYG